MAKREIHLEQLLGKSVLASTGQSIGKIQEMWAEQQGDNWVIVEYWVGPAAIIERLSAWRIGKVLLPLFGRRQIHPGYVVPWDKLDLTDLEKPRLLCHPQELRTFSQQEEDVD